MERKIKSKLFEMEAELGSDDENNDFVVKKIVINT
jgi:hypothetical protein